ncbi:hypothetical protein ETZ82_003161 [Escherichia coli]|nr:hypothetical protein [Escherichia coli]
MADVHDKATRSKNMRAIATRDTAIEKRLASLLTGQGLAFRVQDASLPGRRDISRLQELGWRVLIVWECALRGREKLTDEALSERLEEWICGEGASAQIDTQGIHLLA